MQLVQLIESYQMKRLKYNSIVLLADEMTSVNRFRSRKLTDKESSVDRNSLC